MSDVPQHGDRLTSSVPAALLAYHRRGGSLSVEIDCEPFACEFWPFAMLCTYNVEYQVSRYVPGYFGFGTNGGGEMFAIAPDGRIVCVPFIGMSPEAELYVAASWADFEQILDRGRR